MACVLNMNWYDWFLPTSYFGSIVFGILLTLIFSYTSYRESRSIKHGLFTITGGLLTTIVMVYLLTTAGFIQK